MNVIHSFRSPRINKGMSSKIHSIAFPVENSKMSSDASQPPQIFTVGSLYIAGFTQARSPHVAFIIPTDTMSGSLVHIRIDHATSPTWAYQCRTEKIEGNMFLSSLLKIHDASKGEFTTSQLEAVAKTIQVPENNVYGECGPWVFRVVEELHKFGLVVLLDGERLSQEFAAFAVESAEFARRDRFPNVMVSRFCS